MNEFPDQDSATGEDRPTPGAASAGALIRQAREAAGMHIAALAVALKVPVRRLEALEADRYDLMPSPVFVRALALSVCRSLKVDPQPVVALLPKSQAQRLTMEGRINEPFRTDSQSPQSWRAQLARPQVLAGLVLALAALAVYFVPTLLHRSSTGAEATPVAAPAAEPANAAPALETAPAAALVAPLPVPLPAAQAVPASSSPGSLNPAPAVNPATPSPMPVPVAVPVAPARHPNPVAR